MLKHMEELHLVVQQIRFLFFGKKKKTGIGLDLKK